MVDPRLFGYVGLFSSRDTVKEAVENFTAMMNTIQNGEDKATMMTAALVLSNTLAQISTQFADFIERNAMADLNLIDGRPVKEVTIRELHDDYEFPFESVLLRDLLNKLLGTGDNCTLAALLPRLPQDARLYILMANPKPRGNA